MKTTLPNLIIKAIEEVDENLSHVDPADAVAEVLESNYGKYDSSYYQL